MSITYHKPNHPFICGVDLHSRMIYICIINQNKEILIHRPIKENCTETFKKVLKPYLGKIAISAEACFPYYWLADFCRQNNIELLLGHALYMKHIHGGKAKNDRIDSEKIAMLTINHMLPFAYAYPSENVHLRDLLRRRTYFVHKCAELKTHVRIQAYQQNVCIPGELTKSKLKSGEVHNLFENFDQKLSASINIESIEHLTQQADLIEKYALNRLKDINQKYLKILDSINGIGPIIAMTIILEIDDISRFPTHKDFTSYCRLIKSSHSSAGKMLGYGGAKIGNPHLKNVFGLAGPSFLNHNPRSKPLHDRLVAKHGKGRALSIISHKIGRAVYYMLKNEKVFDIDKFLNEV